MSTENKITYLLSFESDKYWEVIKMDSNGNEDVVKTYPDEPLSGVLLKEYIRLKAEGLDAKDVLAVKDLTDPKGEVAVTRYHVQYRTENCLTSESYLAGVFKWSGFDEAELFRWGDGKTAAMDKVAKRVAWVDCADIALARHSFEAAIATLGESW